jgi:hypothetical protein
MMSLPSHASDGAARATWPQHDIDVESCWRGATKATWSCATVLLSHADDGAAKAMFIMARYHF